MGYVIRAARAQAKFTRRKVEQATGLSVNFLYRVETGGRRPSKQSLQLIANAVGAEVEIIEAFARQLPTLSKEQIKLLQIIDELEKLSSHPIIDKAILQLNRLLPKIPERKKVRKLA